MEVYIIYGREIYWKGNEIAIGCQLLNFQVSSSGVLSENLMEDIHLYTDALRRKTMQDIYSNVCASVVCVCVCV